MKTVIRLAAIAALCASASAVASPANHQSPLGINIRDVKHWGTEMPSVDLFKKAGTNGRLWQTQSDTTWDTQEHAQLDLDAQGWPRTLPAAGSPLQYRYATTLLFSGTNRYPVGRYTVYYDGEGSIFYGGGTRNAQLSTPGIDIVDVPGTNGQLYVSIRQTDPNHTGNYVRNIRVIPPGGTCANDPTLYAADATACPASFRPFTQTYAAEPFHPRFLDDIKRFGAIRFMHFTGTNTTMVQEWSQRVPPTVPSWGGQANDGAPYEVAIQLANLMDASPWFNIPARASDDYVLQFATLLKAQLATSRPIHIEYNNETWNGNYPYSIHALWMQANGIARWPASPLDNFSKQMNWFGMRSSQVCAIVKQVFADQPGRVKCVMGTQLPNNGASTSALDCPLYVAEQPGRAACHANMDALAIGSYFGDHIQQSRFEPVWRTWFAESDGGLAKLFEEVYAGIIPRTGTPAVPMGALPGIRSALQQQGAIATARGLQLVAYEAGSGFDSAQRPQNDPLAASYASLQTLMVAGGRDRRMEAAFKTMLDDWKAAGGNLLMVFSGAQAWSASAGNAAILEYTGQPRAEAPKFDAALNFNALNPCWWVGCDLGTAGVATTAAVVSSVPSPAAGQAVQLTATVSGGTPTGVVTFTAEGLSIAGCDTVPVVAGASGRVATCTTSALLSGSRSIVASYSGDAVHRRSSSAALVLAVGANPNADDDGDGIPNGVELAEGRNPGARDNDVFGNARLFAMQQYRDFLAREGDAGGVSFWANQVASGAMTRRQVVQSFLASAEFEGAIAPVARLYFAYFLRVPDYPGLNFWVGQFRGGSSLDDISGNFAASAEFASRYGALDDTAFVTLIYQNVLGRAPDGAGLAFWVGQLAASARTRGQVMTGFSESAEYRALIANEVQVTMTYAGMLRRAPDAPGFSFWVQYLDAGSGSAALIDGFLAAPEYRARFLP